MRQWPSFGAAMEELRPLVEDLPAFYRLLHAEHQAAPVELEG